MKNLNCLSRCMRKIIWSTRFLILILLYSFSRRWPNISLLQYLAHCWRDEECEVSTKTDEKDGMKNSLLDVFPTWFTVNALAKYFAPSIPKLLFQRSRVQSVYRVRWKWSHVIEKNHELYLTRFTASASAKYLNFLTSILRELRLSVTSVWKNWIHFWIWRVMQIFKKHSDKWFKPRPSATSWGWTHFLALNYDSSRAHCFVFLLFDDEIQQCQG